jgi:hypothetical protein
MHQPTIIKKTRSSKKELNEKESLDTPDNSDISKKQPKISNSLKFQSIGSVFISKNNVSNTIYNTNFEINNCKLKKINNEHRKSSFTRSSTLPRRLKERFLFKIKKEHSASPVPKVANNPENVLKPEYIDSQSSSISSCSTSSSADSAVKNSIKRNLENNFCSSNNESIYNITCNIPHQLFDQIDLNDPKYDDDDENLIKINKCMETYVNSINYFEKIISENKMEIIASSTMNIFESIVGLYSTVQNFNFEKSNLIQKNFQTRNEINNFDESNRENSKYYRKQINDSLVNLIKWSDERFFFNENKNNNHCLESAKKLIDDLNNSLKKFLFFYKSYYFDWKNFCLNQNILKISKNPIICERSTFKDCSSPSASSSSTRSHSPHISSSLSSINIKSKTNSSSVSQNFPRINLKLEKDEINSNTIPNTNYSAKTSNYNL